MVYVGNDSSRFVDVNLVNASGTENVLYSPQGKWGIMMADEGYGLLGGCAKFMEEIYKFVPDLDQQTHLFLEQIRYIRDNYPVHTLGWVPGLLRHLYGEEVAERMLRETGLP